MTSPSIEEALAELDDIITYTHAPASRVAAIRSAEDALASANARVEALEKAVRHERDERRQLLRDQDGVFARANVLAHSSSLVGEDRGAQDAADYRRELDEARSQLASERAAHEVTRLERDRLRDRPTTREMIDRFIDGPAVTEPPALAAAKQGLYAAKLQAFDELEETMLGHHRSHAVSVSLKMALRALRNRYAAPPTEQAKGA